MNDSPKHDGGRRSNYYAAGTVTPNAAAHPQRNQPDGFIGFPEIRKIFVEPTKPNPASKLKPWLQRVTRWRSRAFLPREIQNKDSIARILAGMSK